MSGTEANCKQLLYWVQMNHLIAEVYSFDFSKKTLGKNIKVRLDRFFSNYNKFRYRLSGRLPWAKGYNEYKLEYIGRAISAKGLSCFKEGKLPVAYGYRLDERVVEYPWLLARIKDSERNILDAGSALNLLEILSSEKMKGRKLYIDTLCFEGRPNVIPSPSYLYEDLRDMCFKDDYFDAVCSLSTVEHIGLDNTMFYTPDKCKNEQDQLSFLKAIQEFKRVLKPGGSLYVTIPYGKYKNYGWFQIFDAEMVQMLIDSFSPYSVEKTYYRYENDQWNVSTEEQCQDGDYFDGHHDKIRTEDSLVAARCVACLALIKAQ